ERRGFLISLLAHVGDHLISTATHPAEKGKCFDAKEPRGPAVEFEDLVPFAVSADADRPIAELGVNIFFPDIGRLQDMPVGVDDVVVRQMRECSHVALLAPFLFTEPLLVVSMSLYFEL